MTELIQEPFMILIPALWAVGFVIKQASPNASRLIPIILMFMGVLLAVGLSGSIKTPAIIQGILAASVAVGAHQTGKQSFFKKE